MIRQARVEDIKNKRITRRHGRIVVVTRFYPRYLKKNLIDEYFSVLAPPKSLLSEFIAAKKAGADAETAFTQIHYEAKFGLLPAAFAELERLSLISQNEMVYLVCHCKVGERCHRELLMFIAREFYSAPISRLHFSWSKFAERIERRDVELTEDPGNAVDDESPEDLEG